MSYTEERRKLLQNIADSKEVNMVFMEGLPGFCRLTDLITGREFIVYVDEVSDLKVTA